MVSFDCLYREDVIIKDKKTLRALSKGQSRNKDSMPNSDGATLVSLNDGILPAINIKLDALEEERRLCYVALTRAKEYLHVSSAYEHYISGVKKILRPSVFMSEIN